jgi:predicted nucleic acid-binding protein
MHTERGFRTTIVIDDALMKRATETTGDRTKRKAVELLLKRGITIRKTADVIIATFCISEGHAPLYSDRDFDPFVQYLGLQR